MAPSAATLSHAAAVGSKIEQRGQDYLAVASWALAVTSAVFGIAAVFLLFRVLFQDQSIQFRFIRHWGGFGGSSTGWHLSRGLVIVCCAMMLVLVSSVLGLRLIDMLDKSSTGARSQRGAGDEAKVAKPSTAKEAPSASSP